MLLVGRVHSCLLMTMLSAKLCFNLSFRIVFDINSMDTPQVRASSSKSYILTDIDKDILNELKLWATHKETLNKQFTFTRLQDLNTNQNFINLLCQVVSKCYTESGGVALTLWDGSLPACQSILVEPISKQQQVTSDELMCKAAKRCVEVFLYDDHTMGNVQRVHPGDFVCIRNVHIKEVESNSSVTAEKVKVVCEEGASGGRASTSHIIPLYFPHFH